MQVSGVRTALKIALPWFKLLRVLSDGRCKNLTSKQGRRYYLETAARRFGSPATDIARKRGWSPFVPDPSEAQDSAMLSMFPLVPGSDRDAGPCGDVGGT